MKTFALSLTLVALLGATAGAVPGTGWANPAVYGQYVQPEQTVYAQPSAYRGYTRGGGIFSGFYGGGAYNGAGCDCGHNGHAGTCWDCSNAWAGYCNEHRKSCCAGIWDGFCNERHCDWCGHHRKARGHHCGNGHCGAHHGGCGWKRPLFAKSCDVCDTCEATDVCDDCNRGCRRLGHCRPLAWFGSMCEKGLDNCNKGWDRCNACFAGLRGCFGLGRCGCDECGNGCGIGEASTPAETVLPMASEPEAVPPTPARDEAAAPGPAA